MPRGADHVHEVSLHFGIHVNRIGRLAQLLQIARFEYRRNLRGGVQPAHAVEHGQFVRTARIVDQHLQHEAIDLRLGQRVRPFLLDGVLRGEHEEGPRHRVGSVADGGLPFGHRFEQGTLHLRRSAVDLVREHDVGEHRAVLDGEFAGSRVVNLGADYIRGKQIGSELNPLKLQVQGASDGADRERFREAGNAFEQDVAIGEQADEQAVEKLPLADEYAFDGGVERLEFRSEFLDVLGGAARAHATAFSRVRGCYHSTPYEPLGSEQHSRLNPRRANRQRHLPKSGCHRARLPFS